MPIKAWLNAGDSRLFAMCDHRVTRIESGNINIGEILYGLIVLKSINDKEAFLISIAYCAQGEAGLGTPGGVGTPREEATQGG